MSKNKLEYISNIFRKKYHFVLQGLRVYRKTPFRINVRHSFRMSKSLQRSHGNQSVHPPTTHDCSLILCKAFWNGVGAVTHAWMTWKLLVQSWEIDAFFPFTNQRDPAVFAQTFLFHSPNLQAPWDLMSKGYNGRSMTNSAVVLKVWSLY